MGIIEKLKINYKTQK